MPRPHHTRRETRILKTVAAQHQGVGWRASGPLPPRPRGRGLVDAELTANLSPASDSKTGAATASAKFLIPDPDNPGDLMDGATFTVTNRSLDASGLNGDYIVVARIAGEWRLLWIDC